MIRKGSLVFALFFIAFCGRAQQYTYQAELGPVPETGYYKIPLRPEIAGKLQPGFADLRILDHKQREVPYLVQQEKPEQTRRFFREYEIVSKTVREKSGTTLILRNPNRSPITNISLLIKNTNVLKKAHLSGSSDATNWYAIQDNYVLQSVYSTENTSEVKVFDFPLSDYEYYRLVINDSASAPLNILAAGYYDFDAEQGRYVKLPGSLFSLSDSSAAKQTFLRFSAGAPVLIDKLEFEIDSPAFYLRNAIILVPETYAGRRGKMETNWRAVQQFQLRSDAKNAVPFSGFRSAGFVILIENADNPPLQIREVNAFQLNTQVVAELRKGKDYTMVFGNEKASRPSYDIEYFRDKIPEQLPELAPQALSKITAAGVEKEVTTFFTNKNIIWVAIVLVIGLLGFMTYRMMEETGRK